LPATLYGVDATDPWSDLAGTGSISLVATAASLLPHGARLESMRRLRVVDTPTL
jgi:hypothetical protein